MKRILIIGGSGFLGSHLVNQAKNKYQVIATYFNHKCQLNDVNFKFLDLTDIGSNKAFLERIRPHGIIHNAGLTG